MNIITAGGSGSIVWGDIVQPVFPAPKSFLYEKPDTRFRVGYLPNS